MTRPDEELTVADRLDSADRDFEAPAADAFEQSIPVVPGPGPGAVSRGVEVNEWDAVEQSVVVDLDDEYDR